MTSKGPSSTIAPGSTTEAPSRATSARIAGLRTVAVTRAPVATASWTAALPTPPAPPEMHTRSPTARPHWVNRASWAVVHTSGTAPASSQDSSAGTGIAIRSCTTASSVGMTRSPDRIVTARMLCSRSME